MTIGWRNTGADTIKSSHEDVDNEVTKQMCTVGGGPTGDLDFDERVKGKKYRCNDCGEKFESLSKHPMCASCQSENVTAL